MLTSTSSLSFLQKQFISNNITSILGNCLYSHNTLRALHPGTPEMTYNATIAEGSQKWADNLGDNIKSLVHATGAELGDNGENIFMKSFSGSMDVTCSEAAWAW